LGLLGRFGGRGLFGGGLDGRGLEADDDRRETLGDEVDPDLPLDEARVFDHQLRLAQR
jgi:hypothetical protein